MTLTYFAARSDLEPYAFEWKMLKKFIHFSVTIIICDAVNFNPYECHMLTGEFVFTTYSTLLLREARSIRRFNVRICV